MRLCSVVATPSSLCSQPSSALVRSRGSEPTARCCLPPLTPALPSRPALSAAEQPSECSLRRRLRLPPEMLLLRATLDAHQVADDQVGKWGAILGVGKANDGAIQAIDDFKVRKKML